MITSIKCIALVLAFTASVVNCFAQDDTTATTNPKKLLPATFEAGLGMGFVTFNETFTWNGVPVPDNQIEKWGMPQLYLGGRIPVVAFSQNLSLQVVMSASIMAVVSESVSALGPIDIPVVIMARYGHGATKNASSPIGVGLGAGASFIWWHSFGIADVLPSLYADFAIKGIPIYLRSHINVGSIAFSSYDTLSLWSLSLNWRGLIPSGKKGY